MLIFAADVAVDIVVFVVTAVAAAAVVVVNVVVVLCKKVYSTLMTIHLPGVILFSCNYLSMHRVHLFKVPCNLSVGVCTNHLTTEFSNVKKTIL